MSLQLEIPGRGAGTALQGAGSWGNHGFPHAGRPLLRPRPPRPARDSTRSRPRHPAHRPQVAPGRTLAALRVVPDVAGPDAAGIAGGAFPRRLDLGPELALAEVVLLLEAGDVLTRLGAQHPARAASASEGPVDPPERLDSDQVAQAEH